MTQREFTDQLLPVLAGRWKRMVARPGRNADAFEKAAANEANLTIWESLGEFPIDAAIEAVRAHGREHPTIPDKKGYGWVLGQIRGRLQGQRNTLKDPAAWTIIDEVDLWHQLAKFAKSLSTGRPFGVCRGKSDGIILGDEWGDELFVARNCVGKNPSINEREWTYKQLCASIDGVRSRMLERGRVAADEVAKLCPYPRDAYWALRERWQHAAEAEFLLSEAMALVGEA